MKIKHLIACMVILCAGCHKQTHKVNGIEVTGDCDEADATDTLAIRELRPILGTTINQYDILGDHNKRHWNPIIATRRKQIATLRTWATMLKDKNIKRGYLNWLQYYEDGLNEAQTELDKGPAALTLVDEEQVRHEQNVQCYLDEHHIFPSPPNP